MYVLPSRNLPQLLLLSHPRARVHDCCRARAVPLLGNLLGRPLLRSIGFRRRIYIDGALVRDAVYLGVAAVRVDLGLDVGRCDLASRAALWVLGVDQCWRDGVLLTTAP